uniref:hypothetical protein n=1 Tax=Castellaniella defragrans TaxID=75697 RepID=UPI0033416349
MNNQARHHGIGEKSNLVRIINISKMAFISLIAIPSSASPCIDLPTGAEIFMREDPDNPMTVEKDKYRFTLNHPGSYSGTMIKGEISGEVKITHAVDGATFQHAERLFALNSHGCGGRSIDLVIQLGPGKYGDIQQRDYYRIVFSTDLESVISEFYDPSVSALNAVFPIQSIEGTPSPETGEKIICKGDIPIVERSPDTTWKHATLSQKSYIYSDDTDASKMKSYLVAGDHVIVQANNNNRRLVQFKYFNSKGKPISGWLECKSIDGLACPH